MKRILSLAIAILMVVSLLGVVSAGAEVPPTDVYKDRVLELTGINEEDPGDGSPVLAYYCEIATHYPDYNADPENCFVLIEAYVSVVGEAFAAEVFGDYIMRDNCHKYPDTFGYLIYLPKEDKVYTLSKAYDLGIEDIETVFTEYGLGTLIGDVNSDRVLNIKDATLIQKALVNLASIKNDVVDAFIWSEQETPCYISDFNRDTKSDIKDVTAIQKHLVGLGEKEIGFAVSEPVRIPTETKDHETQVCLVRSRKELTEAMRKAYDNGEGFTVDEKYDDTFFENKALVFISDVIGSSREHQKIKAMSVSGSVLTIRRRINGPTNPLKDINYQYIMIETDKDEVKDIENIRLLF